MVQGTKVPGNERSRERMFQGTNSLENESSRERMVQGTNGPENESSIMGTNVSGNEWSWERIFQHSVHSRVLNWAVIVSVKSSIVMPTNYSTENLFIAVCVCLQHKVCNVTINLFYPISELHCAYDEDNGIVFDTNIWLIVPFWLQVTCPKGHLSEMELYRFWNLTLNLILTLTPTLTITLTPTLILTLTLPTHFGQMTLQTSVLSPAFYFIMVI